ncbi:MAG: DUF502 domain-containing protein [Legionellaceae bacterium]|nr:DUF502 domain-containing protein [Legionellaceae bacterium]
MKKPIRYYLTAGFVVWIPILVTYLIFSFVIDLLDQTISLLPQNYQPEHLFGRNLPGLGVIISLVILLVTGLVATNFLGQRLMSWGESILARIPLVRSIYHAAKQVINAVLATNSQSFRKVFLVEFPRKGVWTVGFQTNMLNVRPAEQMTEEVFTVFVPTTPNPTSGFLIMVPKSEITEIDMTVDEALKYVISMGVMYPNRTEPPLTDFPTSVN